MTPHLKRYYYIGRRFPVFQGKICFETYYVQVAGIVLDSGVWHVQFKLRTILGSAPSPFSVGFFWTAVATDHQERIMRYFNHRIKVDLI